MSMNRAREAVVVEALVALALGGCKSSDSASGTTTPAAPVAGTTPTSTPTTAPTTTAAAAPGKLSGVPASCPSADLVMS
ncbi:MAG TPA: hypothetical protein VGJ28_18210, partial [Micromonosporaceae bacterium]